MQVSFFSQLSILFFQCLKCEFSEKERMVSPLLFGLSLLVLFNFSFGETLSVSQNVNAVFVGQLFLVLLFSLQISLLKQFDVEINDQSLKIIRTSPIDWSAFFFAKLMVIFFCSLMITGSTLVFSILFNFSQLSFVFYNFGFLFSLILVLLGVSAIGCLLAILVSQSSGREVLFPILFFSLTSPLFIIGIQAALSFLATDDVNATILGEKCLGILIGLVVIYVTLGWILFEEVMKP